MSNYQIVSKWNLGKSIETLSIYPVSSSQKSFQKQNSNFHIKKRSVFPYIFWGSVVVFIFYVYYSNKNFDSEQSTVSSGVTSSIESSSLKEQLNAVEDTQNPLKNSKETKSKEKVATVNKTNNAAKDLTSLDDL